jgi:hypothetical protein
MGKLLSWESFVGTVWDSAGGGTQERLGARASGPEMGRQYSPLSFTGVSGPWPSGWRCLPSCSVAQGAWDWHGVTLATVGDQVG